MPPEDRQSQLAMLLEKLATNSAEDQDEKGEEIYDAAYTARLRENLASFLKKNSFHEGQLVKWKKGLRNKILPKQDQPAIVLEILKEPLIQNDRDTGSTYFREPLDIVMAMTDKDGDFVVFHYDSRRFEPYE